MLFADHLSDFAISFFKFYLRRVLGFTGEKEENMGNFDKSSAVQSYWNEDGGRKWSENIDIVESMIAPISDRLIEKISASEGDKVLDIGCGGGITSIKLANLVGATGTVIGIDVSETILNIARSRGAGINNLQFIHRDAASARLGDNKFDIITSRFGVMFFDNPVLAFKNLHAALKPTGRMVFLCWRKIQENPSMAEPARIALEVLSPPAATDIPDPTAPGPFSLSNPAHLTTILQASGFNNIELQEVDASLPMGNIDEAIAYSMKMGPASQIIKSATGQKKEKVAAAIRKTFRKYTAHNRVKVPSATWIVSATK